MIGERGDLLRRRAWIAARWALGIGVVALMLVSLDSAEVLARIRAANGALVVIGVLGLTAVHALGATTWAILCRQLGGLRLGRWSALRLYYAAQALGGVTPANVGGDAYRVVALRHAAPGWSAAVAPVLVQRATSYLALALLALPAIGVLVASRVTSLILPAALVLTLAAGAMGTLMLSAPATLTWIISRLRWRPAASPKTEGSWPRPAPRSVATGTGLGIAFHAASVLLTAVLVVAVDPRAIGVPAIAAVVVARLSLAIPFLPSGLGANEAILALLFSALGLAPQTALAALLLGRLALVLTTLVGTGALLAGRPAVPAAAAPATSR